MKKVSLKDSELELLREGIKPYLTEKRYMHTLNVEAEASALGKIYLPKECRRLRSAALLHDISKKNDYLTQLSYCEKFGIIPENYLSSSPEILHALTGPRIAEKYFPEYVDDEILSAIRWHTTGHDNMSLFEALICFADFVEPSRTFDGCLKIRESFYAGIAEGRDKYDVLCENMVKMFDMTIEHVKEKNTDVDMNTISARDYFQSGPFHINKR